MLLKNILNVWAIFVSSGKTFYNPAAFTCSKLTIETPELSVNIFKVKKKTPKRHQAHPSQPAFTCSKLAIQTVEQGVK